MGGAGVFCGMKYVLPIMMRQRRGSIINTASMQGLVAFAGYAADAATKGGVIQLTRQAALDYAQKHV